MITIVSLTSFTAGREEQPILHVYALQADYIYHKKKQGKKKKKTQLDKVSFLVYWMPLINIFFKQQASKTEQYFLTMNRNILKDFVLEKNAFLC